VKILYLAHRIPYPPDKGDKIRSYHQVRHLAAEHELHLACLVDDRQDLPHVATLEKLCASVDVAFLDPRAVKLQAMGALLGSSPLSVAAFRSRELMARVARRLREEKFDLVYAYSSAMAEYVPLDCSLPKIMDFVDVDSEKWRLSADHHSFPMSWVYRLEAGRMARYEKQVAHRFDRSVLVSASEASVFAERLGVDQVDAIANGVDLDYFAPGEGADDGDPPRLVFTGVMDYFPNVDGVRHFCETMFGPIREAFPEARMSIVGRNPTKAVTELGRIENVEVTGGVPDVRPYMSRAHVAVVPLRIARGIQNKILEAMAMGLPVVGTEVAFEGIGATRADGVRIVDDPAAFAREVVELLGNPELRRQCGVGAREYACRHHRWQDHGSHLDALLQRTVGSRSPTQESLNASTV
jgi:sugar transferase (PEP-CTERM/EpsH1 system associated)